MSALDDIPSDEDFVDDGQGYGDLEHPSAPINPDTFPLGVDGERWLSNTITIRERAMLLFVNAITDKPEWWNKVRDETIVAKWKAELQSFVAQGSAPFNVGFTDDMFEFCLLELQDKAEAYKATAQADGAGGIVSILDTAAAVFKADGRVPAQVTEALRKAAKIFEDVPDKDKDWHPGSNEQVLDLVHPSLWPVVYGTSRVLTDREIGPKESLEFIGSGETMPVPTAIDLGLSEKYSVRLWSKKFQWLPADVSFDKHGKGPAKISSYINNAHPIEHAALYPVVEQLVDIALPMMSAAYHRVKSWSDCELNTERFTERKRLQCDDSNRICKVPEFCEGGGRRRCDSYKAPESVTDGWTSDDDEYYEATQAWYNENHPVQHPDVKAAEYIFPGVSTYQTEGPWFAQAKRTPVRRPKKKAIKAAQLEHTERNAAFDAVYKDKSKPWRKMDHAEKVAIKKQLADADAAAHDAALAAASADETRDHRLQVIVKLANIHLTPDKPRYEGGQWHFEGQMNEHICATALYYYDNENVTESRLAFRTVTNAEEYDDGNFEYEQNDHAPFQEMYGMDPGLERDNTAQPLGDVVTKEGRLLVFPNVLQHQVQPFELEDKTKNGHRKIVAIFLVDPNVRIPSSATVPPQQLHWREESAIEQRLPSELSRMVYDHLDVPYGLEVAKKFREELIEERKALVQTVDNLIGERSWSFCEH